MPRLRDILGAPRALLTWLLTAAVLIVPAGVATGPSPCGVSCPCDEEAEHDHGDAEAEHAAEPCEDVCPEGGPDCGCGLGPSLALCASPAAAASR
jgi:hypothetical protein